MADPKKVWFARVNRSLANHGYTFKQFVENPLYLMSIDPNYEKLILSKYSKNNNFQWYNKPVRLSELIDSFPDQNYAERLKKLHPELEDHMDDDHEGNINIFFFVYRF